MGSKHMFHKAFNFWNLNSMGQWETRVQGILLDLLHQKWGWVANNRFLQEVPCKTLQRMFLENFLETKFNYTLQHFLKMREENADLLQALFRRT